MASMALAKLALTEKIIGRIEQEIKGARSTTLEAKRALDAMLLELADSDLTRRDET
jgi:hypothetical protein